MLKIYGKRLGATVFNVYPVMMSFLYIIAGSVGVGIWNTYNLSRFLAAVVWNRASISHVLLCISIKRIHPLSENCNYLQLPTLNKMLGFLSVVSVLSV